MIRRRRPVHTTAREVFDHILKHVKFFDRIGAYWGQGQYKYDFFRIFDNAWCNSLCGSRAWDRYNNASKRKKGLAIEEFVVSRLNLSEYLEKHLPQKQFKRCEPMIEDFLQWWDDWSYAWDHNPETPARPYQRRRP